MGWFLVRWWWKIFALLRLLSHEDGDIDEEELVRCSSNPQNAKSSPLPVRTESMAVDLLLHQVQKAILHATHQSPNVDQMSITEVQISMEKNCWQIQLNGKNQPNHRSEPAEPLDSPHESPISKRKICSRRRPSTRTFVLIFANMRHFFRTSSPGLYENCNFRFAKRP